MSDKIKKIILTGGGTSGSVVPLLAIAKELKNNGKTGVNYDFLWLGTNNGPERLMVEDERIKFTAIASGKWRRYFSIWNFFDLIKIFVGFFQSLFVVLKYNPDLIMSAGSFVSVPVVWAGWLVKVPSLIHQQDFRPGLANKLMVPFAKIITVTFEKSRHDYGDKALWVGNPIRNEFRTFKISRLEAKQKLGLKEDLPVVLAIGGGTGAFFINDLIGRCAEELTKFCSIILITGQNKGVDINFSDSNFKIFPFLNTEGMIKVFCAADIAVSRCGLGILTELSYFSMPAILIPMPDSHQESNALIFNEANAAVVLNQGTLDKEAFMDGLRELLNNKNKQIEMGRNMKEIIKIDNNGMIIKIIEKLVS